MCATPGVAAKATEERIIAKTVIRINHGIDMYRGKEIQGQTGRESEVKRDI
jgi:hypothetical protein